MFWALSKYTKVSLFDKYLWFYYENLIKYKVYLKQNNQDNLDIIKFKL